MASGAATSSKPADKPATKQRILDATAELFRRYGYNGTGLKQIVAEASAPFGSVYHFFPDGKRQLGDAVVRRSGQMYLELVLGVLGAAEDVVQGTKDVFTGAAAVLRETDYIDACPIGTVALEVASADETLRTATADVFASWVAAATEALTEGGVPARTARPTGMAIIELLEGAFMLSRSMRSTEPLDAAGQAAASLVSAAIYPARPNPPSRGKRA